mgnify:CR=1 FL=1
MQRVKTRTHYSLKLELDQCTNCGGIWFDTNELFTAHSKSQQDLPALDNAKFADVVGLSSQEMHCPIDRTLLKRFNDPVIPSDMVLEACPKCHGFFIDLAHFQSYQSLRVGKAKTYEITDKALASKIQILLENQSDAEFYKSVEKIAKIFSKPVPIRYIYYYMISGLSGYVAFGLLLVLRELWFGLTGASFKTTSKQQKNDKLKSMVEFILNAPK